MTDADYRAFRTKSRTVIRTDYDPEAEAMEPAAHYGNPELRELFLSGRRVAAGMGG